MSRSAGSSPASGPLPPTGHARPARPPTNAPTLDLSARRHASARDLDAAARPLARSLLPALELDIRIGSGMGFRRSATVTFANRDIAAPLVADA